MTNLIEDVSVLTTVPDHVLEKFLPSIVYCIGHAVHESECLKQDITEIDLGFGELHIKVEGTNIRYKFIPSKQLERLVAQTVTSGCSPIVTKLELNLEDKINKTYKELL